MLGEKVYNPSKEDTLRVNPQNEGAEPRPEGGSKHYGRIATPTSGRPHPLRTPS